MNNLKPYIGQPLNLGHWSTDGLVYWSPFTEGNDLVDFSVGKNHQDIIGATWNADHLTFDGLTNRTNIPSIRFPDKDGDITLSVIFNPTNAGEGGQGRIIDVNSSDLTFYFSSVDGGLRLDRSYSITNGDWRIVDDLGLFGTISHVTLTHVGNELPKIYINGLFRTELTQIVTIADGTKDPLDGGSVNFMSNSATSRALPGDLYDVKMYNRALLPNEIQQSFINPNLPIHQFRPELRIFEAVAPTGIPILRRRRECA